VCKEGDRERRAAREEGDRERRAACEEGDRAKAVSPTMVSIMRERESIGSRNLVTRLI
jgi:hypothetical protein